jgi:hypothetical protein
MTRSALSGISDLKFQISDFVQHGDRTSRQQTSYRKPDRSGQTAFEKSCSGTANRFAERGVAVIVHSPIPQVLYETQNQPDHSLRRPVCGGPCLIAVFAARVRMMSGLAD